MSVQFNATNEEFTAITKIVDAYAQWRQSIGGEPIDVRSAYMDLEACHCNGCPLRLQDMLAEEHFDSLIHDVSGIIGTIDRTTGKLTNHFLPRFAVKQ